MATKPKPTVETPEEAAAAEKLAKRQAAAAKAARTRAANAAKRAAAKEAAEQAKLEQEKADLQAKLGALEPEPSVSAAKVEAPAPKAAKKTAKRTKTAPKVSVADEPVQAESVVDAEVVEPVSVEADTPAGIESAQNWIQRINAWLNTAFPTNKNAVLGGIAGLLVACLFFALGFWKTLFIVILVLIGVAVGQIADGDPKLVRTITKLTRKR